MIALRRRLADDSGTSLMELIVGMAIMAIFMGLFTGAMLLMSNTVNKVEAVSTTSSQLTNAFLTLDREVRYANNVSTPAWDSTTSAWHVEFSSNTVDHSTSPATQTTMCTQLRIVSNQLSQRTWKVDANDAAVSGTGTAWKPLASNLTPSTVTQNASPAPFIATTVSVSSLQTLTVNLSATSTAPGKATSYSSTVFTALNSAPDNVGSACQQVGSGDPAP